VGDRQYRKRLWFYSILVVIASICGLGTPLLKSIHANSAVSWVLGIMAVVLFLFATVNFGIFLKLKGRQWVAAILLLLLAWVGSVIYLTTRKPNLPKG